MMDEDPLLYQHDALVIEKLKKVKHDIDLLFILYFFLLAVFFVVLWKLIART